MFSKNRLFLPLTFLIGSIWCFGLGMLLMFYLQNCTGFECLGPYGNGNPPIGTKVTVQEEYDLIIVTKNLPHKILYVDSVKRDSLEQGTINYFDGSSWSVSDLVAGSLKIDEGKTLQKFSNLVSFESKLKNLNFKLATLQINSNMTIRSEKKFAKFGGVTNGSEVSLTINGETFPSYAVLLKGFNFDTSRIDIADLRVNTDWFVYWDKDWNFYHLDKTDVKKFDPRYESHEFLAKIVHARDLGSEVTYLSNIKVLRKGEDGGNGGNSGKDGLSGLTVSYNQNSKPYTLDLDFRERFVRKYLGASFFGGVATSKEGGIGVFLYTKT